MKIHDGIYFDQLEGVGRKALMVYYDSDVFFVLACQCFFQSFNINFILLTTLSFSAHSSVIIELCM